MLKIQVNLLQHHYENQQTHKTDVTPERLHRVMLFKPSLVSVSLARNKQPIKPLSKQFD